MINRIINTKKAIVGTTEVYTYLRPGDGKFRLCDGLVLLDEQEFSPEHY